MRIAAARQLHKQRKCQNGILTRRKARLKNSTQLGAAKHASTALRETRLLKFFGFRLVLGLLPQLGVLLFLTHFLCYVVAALEAGLPNFCAIHTERDKDTKHRERSDSRIISKKKTVRVGVYDKKNDRSASQAFYPLVPLHSRLRLVLRRHTKRTVFFLSCFAEGTMCDASLRNRDALGEVDGEDVAHLQLCRINEHIDVVLPGFAL